MFPKRPAAATAVLMLSLAVAAVAPAAATGSSPWTDPSANGTITFCDRNGQAITSGRTSDKPFVWKAVGSAPAPAPYAASGAVAQLYLFAPIKGSDPNTWAGEAMAGGSTYTDVAHPTGSSTSLDLPLSVFLGDYRLLWDGYIQARLVYSRAGYGAAPQYAAATLLVSGSTWKVVGPVGTAPCSAGSAVSDEINALHLPASGVAPAASPTSHPSAAPTASPGQRGTAGAPGSLPSDAGTSPRPASSGVARSTPPAATSTPGLPTTADVSSVAASTDSPSQNAVAADRASSASSSARPGALVAMAVLLAATAAGLWVRRRRGVHR